MKTIGLLGGMSWQSTRLYYQYINEGVRAALGGLHSAPIILNSLDHEAIDQLKKQDLQLAKNAILDGARVVAQAGADCLLVCTNTVHMFADDIQQAIGDTPLLHIGDVTARAIKAQNIDCIALLGTKLTMQMDFYKQHLSAHGIRTVVPDDTNQDVVNATIYDELCHGIITEQSRQAFSHIIAQCAELGAQGVILGCTEIPLLVRREDSCVPTFDTTKLHAQAAVDFCLNN